MHFKCYSEQFFVNCISDYDLQTHLEYQFDFILRIVFLFLGLLAFIHSYFHKHKENGIGINWYWNPTSVVNKAKKTFPSHYILWHFFWSNSTFGLNGYIPCNNCTFMCTEHLHHKYYNPISIYWKYISIWRFIFPKTLAIGYWIKFKEKQTRPRMVCNVWVTQKIKKT